VLWICILVLLCEFFTGVCHTDPYEEDLSNMLDNVSAFILETIRMRILYILLVIIC